MDSVVLLDRRVMTAQEAARQLAIPATTLIRWLEGEHRAGRSYPPVLREQPTGQPDMTWGEVVEARYLRAYRAKNVPMQRLRPFIAGMRRRAQSDQDGGDRQSLSLSPEPKHCGPRFLLGPCFAQRFFAAAK